MTGEGAVMASVRLVGVGSDTHCDGEHDRRALLWPVFSQSAWVHSATVEDGKRVEGVAMACELLVHVGSARVNRG